MAASLPSDTTILAWARLVRAHGAAMAEVEGALKAADLPPLSWYDVLFELRRAGAGGLRPHEIESRLLIAQHNVSRLVDRLEQSGLVRREKCEEDGRGQVVRLEEAGRAMLRRMWPVYGAAIERTLGAKLSAAEMQTLAALLEKIAHDR